MTSAKKTFVVLNPVAGQSDRDVVRENIQQVLRDHQIEHEIYETKRGDDLHEIVKAAHAEGFERFLAAGGDGTVSGVASGLAGTQTPVVIIPTGTANAFARILGIPLQLEEAIQWWLTAQQIKAVDAMMVKERYHILNISVGTSSLALSDIQREEKRKLGSLAYWLKGLQSLAGISPFRFQYRIDGQDYGCRAAELIVANSGIIQFRPLQLAPDIHIDDGMLAVCTIQAKNLIDYVRLAGDILFRREPENRELTCVSAHQRIHIRTKQSLPVQADGEIIGETPLSIEVIPAAIHFLIPENSGVI